MDSPSSKFEAELQLSARWIGGLLGVFATCLVAFSEGIGVGVDRVPLYTTCIALYCGAILIWLLDLWQPRIARPLGLMLLFVAVHASAVVLRAPTLLSLSSVVVLISIAVGGRSAAIVATAGGIIAQLVWSSQGQPPSDGVLFPERMALSIRILGLLITLGFVFAAYRRIAELSAWLWQRFTYAQANLAELRDRKAELEQALDDLEHANRQLALANERVTAMRAVAEEAQKAKATFVAKVSHELRTPLNMIIGLVTLMIEAPEIYAVTLSPEMRKDLGIVNRNCEHLSHMVNDVLNLTQMEAGRLVLHRERFDLRQTIDAAVESISPLLEKKKLYLRKEIPSDLPSVYCDRTRIQQVILNLVSNAARFTDSGGITLRVEWHAQEVIVSVADTGPGIRPEDRERIFEPFCQGSLGLWQDRGGSGLGLTISKQFIEQHGGRIWLDSEPGQGTTFYFSLPISEPVPHVVRPGHWINPNWTWLQRRSWARFSDEHYRPRIVICDETGDLYKEFAQSTNSVEFVDARTPNAAILALQECPAHALLLNSPVPDALPDYIERIQNAAPGTLIIGCSVPPLIERMQSVGATGYLVKPVTRTDLEQLLDSFESRVQRVLIIDDDPDVLDLFTRLLLVCDASLHVETAQGGLAGLEAIRDASPDLVLLDVYMPDLDGWQVLEHLRGEPETQALPVYMVSAHDPATQAPGSRLLVASMGEEFSLSKLLEASLTLSALFLSPDGELHPAPLSVAEGEPVLQERP